MLTEKDIDQEAADPIKEIPQSNQAEEYRKAPFAGCAWKPNSEAAHELVDKISGLIAEHEKRKRKRGSKQAQFDATAAGFLGDLLVAVTEENPQGWVYRPMGRSRFSSSDVTYHDFKSLTDEMTQLRLIEEKPGFSERFQWDDDDEPCMGRKAATRFRASSPDLWEAANSLGISSHNVRTHFILRLPSYPLILRGQSGRHHNHWEETGSTIKFPHTRETDLLANEVKELNEFLDQIEIRGGTHRDYNRIFNKGNDDNFHWNKGGRLYSQGDETYQRLNKEERLRMTMDGEPVSELDIRASYLTILHSVHGCPLDQSNDPYVLPELGLNARGAVKSWCAVTFGSEKHFDRWPTKIIEKYLSKTGRKLGRDYPVRMIRDHVCRHYPLLADWEKLDTTWAALGSREKAPERAFGSLLRSGPAAAASLPSLPIVLVPTL
ncbi:hypothetical protein [Rhodovulum sp. PH10]|uniref:hypothetical protein n=1 Tax=Rhodovulum sp. PH10 TaxID=1187851 RepID=UPI0012F87761|nr:hypothetical protein [Rhodovulum sp. PH10]